MFADGEFFNLQKAFDTVVHKTLLPNLTIMALLYMVELQEAEKPIFAIIDTMLVNVLSAPWTDYPISLTRHGSTQVKVHSFQGCCNDWFRSYLSEIGVLVMVSLRVLCWVLGYSWFISMIFIWQLNVQKLYFSNDTHLLHFSKAITSLCSKINTDLRILTCWLNTNKISVNSSKTEFILQRRKLNTYFQHNMGKLTYH